MSAEAPVCFWFRRDLRLVDNRGFAAAASEGPVFGLFILDDNILSRLKDRDDARVHYILKALGELRDDLRARGSDLLVARGDPPRILAALAEKCSVTTVHTNRDYEPYARRRDEAAARALKKNGATLRTHKDQVLFEPDEILKGNGEPYAVFTPYFRNWRARLEREGLGIMTRAPTRARLAVNPAFFQKARRAAADAGIVFFDGVPLAEDIDFKPARIALPPLAVDPEVITHYKNTRDIPAIAGTSRLGVHLRFGVIGIRQVAARVLELSAQSEGKGGESAETFLAQLAWREFFTQILFHHPRVIKESYYPKYEAVAWRRAPGDLRRWREGQTGYPLVDAGMRELAATGYMHNRVRMVVASFLCKHLLIHWREGEQYFARKLLDFELASNNGSWQWCAGTGCDAAPYFRVFNPEAQLKKFDKNHEYTRRWVPELGTKKYPEPMVEHRFARERAMAAFKRALR